MNTQLSPVPFEISKRLREVLINFCDVALDYCNKRIRKNSSPVQRIIDFFCRVDWQSKEMLYNDIRDSITGILEGMESNDYTLDDCRYDIVELHRLLDIIKNYDKLSKSEMFEYLTILGIASTTCQVVKMEWRSSIQKFFESGGVK